MKTYNGELLKNKRLEREMSREKFKEYIKLKSGMIISKETIQDWESNKSVSQLKVFYIISQCLKCKMEDFFE